MSQLFRSWICCLLLCGTAQAAEIVTLAGNSIKGNSPDGSQMAMASIGEPYGLVIGPDGGLYVCEIAAHLVRRVDLKSGEGTVVAGSGVKGFSAEGGNATQVDMDEPYEVRFDSKGNLLTVDMKNAVIWRMEMMTKQVSVIAGTGTPGFSGDNGPATAAQLSQPHAIILDAQDNIYVCDLGNVRVRKIDAETGVITTVVGGGKQQLLPITFGFDDLRLPGPRAMDLVGGDSLILAMREGNRIYRVQLREKKLTLLAGTGKKGYSPLSTPGPEAELSGPKGVAVDYKGDIYFADTESHTIRVIRVSNGQVETVAGTGKRGDGPDGDPLKCSLARPHGICVDQEGNLYIGDSENHRVRMVKMR